MFPLKLSSVFPHFNKMHLQVFSCRTETRISSWVPIFPQIALATAQQSYWFSFQNISGHDHFSSRLLQCSEPWSDLSPFFLLQIRLQACLCWAFQGWFSLRVKPEPLWWPPGALLSGTWCPSPFICCCHLCSVLLADDLVSCPGISQQAIAYSLSETLFL